MISYKMLSERDKEKQKTKKHNCNIVPYNNNRMDQKEFDEYVKHCEEKGFVVGARVFKKISPDKIIKIVRMEKDISKVTSKSIPPYFIYLEGNQVGYGVNELVLVPECDL